MSFDQSGVYPMFRLQHLLVVALLLLPACAATPPQVATRYLLPPDASTGATVGAGEGVQVLILRQLQLADFLNDEGIVLQLDDITLNAAATQRWAEPLRLLLQRGLRQRLQHRLPDTTVLDAAAPAREGLQLRIEVERFHGTHEGVALTSGQWQLRSSAGVLLTQQPFLVQTPLGSDGYPALVRALGSNWDQVAHAIARGVASHAAE